MSVYLILTAIGDDRPGLVGELSSAISAHQGNWLESSMSHLAGKFAGIVKEVSQVLARHAVNVEELVTNISSAPMSAETLFHAHAELNVAADLDARLLKTELERLSDELMVDITLDERVQ